MTEPQQPDYRALLKRSLVAIDKLEGKLAAIESAKAEPIAVVGMACRFPGSSNDLASFWKLLHTGTDAVTVVPAHRWDAEASYDTDPDVVAKSYTKWGAFIDEVETFDASFFGISPREAVSLDPQQRLLLEVTWESLEHAGIAPSSIAGTRAGIFVGISTLDYANMIGEHVGLRNGDAYSASGSAHSIASGRLSYFLGVHGPNYVVDTACSSSIVAIHNAIISLRNGETGLAIAGGVSLTLSDVGSILTSRARMMSFDGHCKTFDESADGYVRGEGCGMVVLKRLSDAERDGDRILAVLRGSAINQDGRSSGLTAPNGTAQEAVIRDALSNARLSPKDISVIEAHGTGTPLGDPIEMKALGAVFGDRSTDKALLVGSVKTNIGHLEAASGVAGLIKVILAMRAGVVPPHLHFKNPNHLIPWDALPVRVPTAPTEWVTEPGVPRRAGVSSFGFSGTNSHLIVEEAPAPKLGAQVGRIARPQLLVLSAQTTTALRQQAERYAAFLQLAQGVELGDIAFTAATCRSHLPERLTLVAEGADSAADQLSRFVADEEVPGLAVGRFTSGTAPEIGFLFSGQGAQYPGMSRELYETEPVFRAALDACATIADGLLPSPLIPVILGDEGVRELLDDTAFTQPALFAVEYALAQLWKSWGVEPAIVMGHSVGEYVAACLAGVFSLEDGLRLIAARGRLMSVLPRDGSMVAVFASRERVASALRGHEADVDIGAVNGPTNTVISGRTHAVDAILNTLAAEGIEFARLNVSHAFHSPLMDPMLDEFERIASTVTYAAPSIGLVSNVTGRMAGAEVATAAYWRQHVRAAVQFTDSIATLHAENIHTFLEIGPSPVLVGMGQRCDGAEQSSWLPSLKKGRSDRASMLESVGRLHVGGQPIAWSAVCDAGARRVDLPTYPFQRERYWFDSMYRPPVQQAVSGRSTGHPLLGDRIASPMRLYQTALSIATTPWLSDHRIYESPLFPVTGFLELAMAAGRHAIGTDDVALSNVSLREGLTIPEPGAVTMQVIVTPHDDGTQQVQVFSDTADDADGAGETEWRLHLSATVARSSVAAPPAGLRALPSEGRSERDVPEYYKKLHEQGAYYGPAFRGITSIARSADQVLGHVRLPDESATDSEKYFVHPALLDSCVQLIGVGLPWADDPRSTDDICVPVGLASYHVYRPAVTDIWCHVESVRPNASNSSITSDFVLTDVNGEIVARVEALEMHRVTRAAMQKVNDKPVKPDWMLEVEWQASPMETAAIPASGKWLVVTDGGTLAGSLATQLGAKGASVFVASHATEFAATAAGWSIDVTDASHYKRLFAEASTRDAAPWQGVVSMVGAHPVLVTDDNETLHRAHTLRIAALLAMLPAVVEAGARFSIVTHGTQAVGDVVPDLADAPIWGLANVVASEYPALRVTRIDMDTAPRKDDAELLAAALTIGDSEDRVALRGGQRYVARLAQGVLRSVDAMPPRRLEIMERGILENLQLNVVPREAPGVGEVEIRVYATGLNFRDVLNALGMYPGDPGPLGNECSGVITAVGEGVDDLFVGDEVVTMIDRSFATYVLAPAMQTVRKPANLSFVEAATIPVTFLTAEYALSHLAGMKAGDKVLIHAATGGVGMAAIQLARRAGAEIFGTAGSPAKRAMAQALGCHHLSDSRSLVFADDFDRITNGDGVDIVLNSLAGDFIPTSLRLLKRGGHFIEIGKTGIWDKETVAQSFPGVSYHPLYLGEVTAAEPQFMRTMLQRLMDDFESGALTPLPQRVYPLERAEEAFRFMGQGLHTGKIVITQHRTPEVRDDASYLITGGLGGLGIACAQWLAGLGARSLVLLGRRAPTPEVERQLAELRASGVTVTVASCDIANEREIAEVLELVRTALPPLRGILHAAGVVDDGMLPEQTVARFERVMAPKVQGTWNLHQLTRSLPIDFFVLFSSGAALLGSPGQGNYAAANSFMDAVAYVRGAQGRHGVSINWGSWAEVGMAAEVGEAHRRRWASQGLGMIAPADGVRMLQDILQRSTARNVAALPLDKARLPQNLGVFFERLLVKESKQAARGNTAGVDVLRQITDATPEAREDILRVFLTEQIVRVLALSSASRARPDQSLMDIGMDSLTAMELRNRVQGAVKVRLSVADLLQGPTINQLTTMILGELDFGTDAVVAAVDASASWEEGSL